MSILTKVLAVLLSVFAILLAGMFVVFVGNADNYKKMYDDQKTICAGLKGDMTVKDQQFNEQMKKIEELEKQLTQKVQDTEAEKSQLASELRGIQREADKYQADADRWKGVMEGLQQSVRNLQASLQETQAQLDAVRAQGIKDQKDLTELTAYVNELEVQKKSLEAERRRLLEQKKELETQIATAGAPAKEIIPVTPLKRTAAPATVTPAGTRIQGLVLEVGQNLVTLSVGSADGVKENMVFHVYRGESFVCDVIVTNVDVDRCAGTLDLVQYQPKINDTASTQ